MGRVYLRRLGGYELGGLEPSLFDSNDSDGGRGIEYRSRGGFGLSLTDMSLR